MRAVWTRSIPDVLVCCKIQPTKPLPTDIRSKIRLFRYANTDRFARELALAVLLSTGAASPNDIGPILSSWQPTSVKYSALHECLRIGPSKIGVLRTTSWKTVTGVPNCCSALAARPETYAGN